LTINQHVYKKVPYDTLKDFVPVTQTTSIAFLLVVPAQAPYKTAADLVAAAKAKPGAIKFASAGIGNQSQLAAELLAGAAGVNMLHVPYKGEAPALTDLIGGQVDFIFGTMPALLPQIKAGKLKALMVGQPKRSGAVADVPTANESGFASVHVTGWTGIVAPAGTSPAVVKRLSEEVQKILALPDVRSKFQDVGIDARGGTPEELRDILSTEIDKWNTLVTTMKLERQ
jgi:tripartite-type tricarboxylate transporter receptor subunit TctC